MGAERTASLLRDFIHMEVAIALGADPAVGCAMTGEQNDCGRFGQARGEFRGVLSFADARLNASLILDNGRNSIGESLVIADMHDVQMARKAIGHGQSLPEHGLVLV